MIVPPPPGRRVSRSNSNTGEGGWAPWRLEIGRDSGGHGGTRDSGCHDGSGSSGGHGGTGDSGGHGGAGNLALIFSGGQGGSGSSVALALGPATQAEDIWSPKKNYWGSSPLVGALEERAHEGALEEQALEVVLGSRTEPAGALESRTEPAGALGSRTEPAGALGSWTEPAGVPESWTEPAEAQVG